MTEELRPSARRSGALWLAVVALVVVLAETVSATSIAVSNGESLSEVVESFAFTNLAIAVCFGGCGALLAWHRPRHPVGWLLAVSGALQGATGVAATVLLGAHTADDSSTLTWVAATVFSWAWPWSMGLGFFLALLYFPDGRLPSRRWWPVAVGIGLTGLVFVLSSGTDPASSEVGGRLSRTLVPGTPTTALAPCGARLPCSTWCAWSPSSLR